MEDEPLPKVNPSLLQRAGTMCPLRLEREYTGARGSYSPVNMARLRDAFLDAARTNHAELRRPSLEYFTPPDRLLPEEAAVFRQAARWYVELFGDRAVEVHLHDCDDPTVSSRRGVRIGGWVDLTVVDEWGHRELRQLALRTVRLGEDVLDANAIRLAVLRLARWTNGSPIRVAHADLIRGDLRERVVDTQSEIPALAAWFDSRLALVRERVAEPVAVPGADCGSCNHVARCSVVGGGRGSSPRGDLRPEIITLSPSALERWLRCHRLWRSSDLLRLPASDEATSPDHGLFVHELLRVLHEQGSCQDPAHVTETLEAHAVDGPGRVRDHVAAHVRRCPIGAQGVGHEYDAVRFHRPPGPLFLGTARIDALWAHDGVLDARDYKTGGLYLHRVVDDARARLQAWVLAPLADRLGLRLQLRYEYLSPEIDDDPEPFEPSADDLGAIDQELTDVVRDMWSETSFAGVNDAAVCGTCRYRSVCPDSASPTEPSWPVVEPADRRDDVEVEVDA